jgi:predicted dehydrogenase
MRTLSVGVVGAGIIAREAHLPVLSCMPDARVDWICDADNDRARALGKANGARAIEFCSPDELPACDAALIAIPLGVRGAYFDVFANRGTAVLAEKPFAISASDHRKLIDRFEPHRLACGYMRRFYSPTQLLRHLVRTTPFGPLVRMQISEGNRSTGSRVDQSYLDDTRQSASGGILSELGCHSLDQALFITDARAYDIQACEFVFDGKVDRKISASIRLLGSSYLPNSGAVLDYCVSWLDRQTNTITLEFERSTVWVGIKPWSEVYMGDPSRPESAIRLMPPARWATTVNQAFYLQWQAFLEGVCTETESAVSALSALLGTALIEDLYSIGRGHA